ERFDLFVAPRPRLGRIDGDDAEYGAFAAGERHAEVPAIAEAEHDVGFRVEWVGGDVLARDRRPELDHVASEPARGGSARARHVVEAEAGHGTDHELAAFERRHGARIRAEQR